MHLSKEIILNGLKELEKLERGLYSARSPFSRGKNVTLKLETSNYPNFSNSFEKFEFFDGNNVSLIKTFPNAILLENSIFNLRKKTERQEKIKQQSDNGRKEIWDILDKLRRENGSESLETLTTESEESSKNEIEICKSCKSTKSFVEDQHTGLVVCSKCGAINGELLDQGPEWRHYNNDDNHGEGLGRCGCPSNFFFPKSSQGTILVGTNNNRIKRKQKWNAMVYKERSLNQVFEIISQVCAKNNIPKIIVDTAKFLYKKISDCKHKIGANAGKQIIIRGVNRMSIIAACVHKACEMNKNPRSTEEIARIFNLDEKKVNKGRKQFRKIMNIVDDGKIILDQHEPNTIEDYIRRFCSNRKLKISEKCVDLAILIANNCCRMKLASDHNPQSIAAGAILLMAEYYGLNIDKKTISKTFGTSDVTLDKIYKKISPYVDALVDDEITDYIIKKFKING
ncbi:MAG: transcription initiation factor IIB family protein [Thermoplasmata archaeon]